MKRLLTTALAAVLLALAVPARAGDGGKDAPPKKPENQALVRRIQEKIRFFRKDLASRDKGRRMNAILELSLTKHDLVIKELGERALRHRDPDVREAAACVLGDMTNNPDLAGSYLRDNLMKNEDFPEIQRSIIISIGKLRYRGALEQLEAAAAHLNEEKYKYVTVEVVRTMGLIGDPRCLPFLLWMAEYGGHVEKWSTGSVTVDTGAAGDKDQKAAEAAWKAKYGHVKPKKPKPPMIRLYMQELRNTVKKITGQEFANATEFRKWLVANAKRLGLDPKKISKKH